MKGNKELFEKAKSTGSSEMFKGEYFGSLDLGEKTKYVLGLEYSPFSHPETSENKKILAATGGSLIRHLVSAVGISGLPSTIKIYPEAFENDEEYFLQTLRHEIRHAEQLYKNPLKYFYRRNLAEKDARDHEKLVN